MKWHNSTDQTESYQIHSLLKCYKNATAEIWDYHQIWLVVLMMKLILKLMMKLIFNINNEIANINFRLNTKIYTNLANIKLLETQISKILQSDDFSFDHWWNLGYHW